MSLVENYLAEYIDKMQPLCKGRLGEIQSEAYKSGLPIIPNEVVKLMGFVLGIGNRHSCRLFGRIHVYISS